MTLAQALQDIEVAIDTAHDKAAQIFLDAARQSVKRFNLRRHTLTLKAGPDLLVKDTNRKLHRPWWELGHQPHDPDTLLQAIADIGTTFDNLPEPLQRKLDNTTL